MNKPEIKDNMLAPFRFLGLEFDKSANDKDYPTTCPFSEKEGKMYVNSETGQWNSFTSDKKGNVITFMREFYNLCLESTEDSDLKVVCEDRKLPLEAIKGQVAFNPLTSTYLIPYRNYDGLIVNLTSWGKGRKPMKMPGLALSLIGLEKLKDNNKIIYLCEGEWDYIALTYLLSRIHKDKEYVAIGVPGANTFKETWIPYFQKKEVNVLYDNDKAGYDGQVKVQESLKFANCKIKYLLFPEVTKTKYDIRDMMIQYGKYPNYHDYSLEETFVMINKWLDDRTQHQLNNGQQAKPVPDANMKIPDRLELEAMFMKHLKLKNTKDIAIIFGTLFANKYKGDPIWLFLVAPPGGSKTELLMTLSKSPYIETVSTLTPAAMISGFQLASGKPDPSLLKKVDGRCLIVKDMTTMLSMQPLVRDEVFGILRDAYDGYVEKWFATHKKSYTTHFGCIAGVTPAIDAYNSVMTTLGARFIHWRIGTNDTIADHKAKILKAMKNVNTEDIMREELQDISYRFLEQPMNKDIPYISDDIQNKLISMAMFTSSLRASIIRDKYTQDQLAPIFKEVGTRLAKVYIKLSYGLCQYFQKKEVDEEILDLVREVALDTCPSIILNLVTKIYIDCQDSKDGTTKVAHIAKYLNISKPTLFRILADLELQNVVVKITGEERVISIYRLSTEIDTLIREASLFKINVKDKFIWVNKNNKSNFH